ncbi:MAG: hypothetical protein ACRDSJ_12620 [Rubrobacteraceae bacterium]
MVGGNNRTDRHITTRTLCGFGETLRGERCELSGEVRFMGLLLCEKHARQLELEDRISLLRGISASLELCLRNVSIRRNAAFTRLLQSQRAEAAVELEFARQNLRENAG